MTTSQQLSLHSPLDMHVHFREGAMARVVVPLTAKYFSGAVVMPNLIPPVTTKERLEEYRREIREYSGTELFEPYMTLFLQPYTHKQLEEMKDLIIGVKLYPKGITTNSEGGIRDLSDLKDTFLALEDLDIPLLVHGETSGFVMDREREFTSIYAELCKSFPKLRIVMEHITTAEAVALLDRFENLFATITIHHLLTTLDDMAGGMLNPHLFCKPIPKRPEDREALVTVACSGHPKVSFGSDSAPHPQDKKECSHCAAGVFTAPIALQLLAELFEQHSSLNNLQSFVSDNAQRIYRINPPRKDIWLKKQEFVVPAKYGEVIPFCAEQSIKWIVGNG